MFALAALIGATSYVIFFLGLFGELKTALLLGVTGLFFLGIYVLVRRFVHEHCVYVKLSRFEKIMLVLIGLQLLINLIGALGPELSFDALWYHLILPKLYLQQSRVAFIPGSLFAYSAIPQLIQMLYIPALALGGEIIPKLIHFGFGILTLVAIYVLARKVLPRAHALLAVLVMSSNLVFAWQMTTAYVDLPRAWFEVLALLAFLHFEKKKQMKWLGIVGGMIGLAAATKIIGLSSLLIFIGLLFLNHRQYFLRKLICLCIPALFVLSPWLVFAYVSTGNPIYPLLTSNISFSVGVAHFPYHWSDIVQISKLFFRSADPISPIYIMVLPILLTAWAALVRTKKPIRTLALYSLFSFLLWFHLPKDGGGRFILAYLPVWSVLASYVVTTCRDRFIQKALLVMVFAVAGTTLMYRFTANIKYFPVLFGQQSKQEFLMKHLNFSFGDFYDEDQAIAHLVGNNTVLIFGGHNLFYADFPFIHETSVKNDQGYTYILTIDRSLPEGYSHWKLMYENARTRVKLYHR